MSAGSSPRPPIPWGTSVSANSHAGDHGYHLVWTRDEYEMATSLMSAGDTADAKAALQYIFSSTRRSPSGAVKQGTVPEREHRVRLAADGTRSADPIILAWQLGATNSADWGPHRTAGQLPGVQRPVHATQERCRRRNSGTHATTMAAEIMPP